MKRSWLALVFLITGCGAAPGNGYDPPYVTLYGTMTSTTNVSPNLRVALVWTNFTRKTLIRVAEDVPVQAIFPVSFELPVHDKPPAEALISLSDGSVFALANIVAYEDGNQNGALDVIGFDTTTSPDRIVGRSSFGAYYLEQGPSLMVQGQTHPGYNLITIDGPGPAFGCWSEETCFPADAHTVKVVPISTSISIALVDDPTLETVLCAEKASPPFPKFSQTTDCEGLPGTASLLECLPGGRGYFYTDAACKAMQPFCLERCDMGFNGCPPTGALPSGWPCSG